MSRSPLDKNAPEVLRRPFALASLRDGRQAKVRVEADAKELLAIAAWLDVPEARALRADLTLTPDGDRRVVLAGLLDARLVQTCVVTLDPIETNVRVAVSRVYLRDASAPVSADEDAELVTGDVIDVGAAVAEELSLAYDPFPRREHAPSSETQEPAEPATVRPFAGLDKLTKG